MKLIIALLMVGSNAWASAAGGVPIHDLKIVSEKGNPIPMGISSWRERGGYGRGYERDGRWGRGGGWGRRGGGREILFHVITKRRNHQGTYPSPQRGSQESQ